ncbi:MAG: hypothetical protein RL710_582 [Pseudomonadota bacterium]|jgi:hypothetical protein
MIGTGIEIQFQYCTAFERVNLVQHQTFELNG